jgi:DNA-binding response OmpR family regulator
MCTTMKNKNALTVDEDRHEVRVNGKEIHLARREYDILIALRTSNKTMSRTALLTEICGDDIDEFSIDIRTVDQHVCRLRKKLGIHVIQSVMSRGYKFAAL